LAADSAGRVTRFRPRAIFDGAGMASRPPMIAMKALSSASLARASASASSSPKL
jgi:hypothetical protein